MPVQVFLNAADEGTATPYVVVASDHQPTRGLDGKLADHVTFTIDCYGLTGALAEALADGVQDVIAGTQDALRLIGRSGRTDPATLLEVATLTADTWLDEPLRDTFAFPFLVPGVAQFSDPTFDDPGFDLGGAGVLPSIEVPDGAAQLYALLAADAGIAALNAKVFLNSADEGTPKPYVVMSANHGPSETLLGELGADNVTFSLACWGFSALQAEALADAVEALLGATQLLVTNRTGGLDQATLDDVAVVEAAGWLDAGEALAISNAPAPVVVGFDVSDFDLPGFSEGGSSSGALLAGGNYDEGDYDVPGFTESGALPTADNSVAEMIAFLAALPDLQSIGAAIYLNAADLNPPLPYVVVTATHDMTRALSGDLISDHVTFTFACWGGSALVAEEMADAIESALSLQDDVEVLARGGGFDQATTMDVAVVTVDRWE